MASQFTTTITLAGALGVVAGIGVASSSPDAFAAVTLLYAASAIAMSASKSICSEVRWMPASRFRLKTCSRNGWNRAMKLDPSPVVPRIEPQNAISGFVPVRNERFRWIRAWVASSSASAAALARLHSWRRSLIDPFFAFFNNPPAAAGVASPASAISSAWSAESSPLRRASSTSGWSRSFFAVSTVRLALPFEVPVFLARSSAALAPWFSANRAARRSFNDMLARSFLITQSNNASAAWADSVSTRRSRARSSVPAQSSFAASNTSASPAANLIGPLCATPLTENAGRRSAISEGAGHHRLGHQVVGEGPGIGDLGGPPIAERVAQAGQQRLTHQAVVRGTHAVAAVAGAGGVHLGGEGVDRSDRLDDHGQLRCEASLLHRRVGREHLGEGR